MDDNPSSEERREPNRQPAPPVPLRPEFIVERPENECINPKAEQGQRPDYAGQAAQALTKAARAEWIMVIVTAAMLIVSYLQYLANRGQLEASRGQLEVMRKTLKQMDDGSAQTDRMIAEVHRAAGAMEESLKQSQLALDSAIKSARLDQRAWLGVKEIVLVTPDPGKEVSVRVTVINSGRTPARDVTAVHCLIGATSKITNFDEFIRMGEKATGAKYSSGEMVYSSAIPPGGMFYLAPSMSPAITAEQIEMIKSGGFVIHLALDIAYKDVFGDSHVTKSFAIWSPEKNGFAAQQTHNDAN